MFKFRMPVESESRRRESTEELETCKLIGLDYCTALFNQTVLHLETKDMLSMNDYQVI